MLKKNIRILLVFIALAGCCKLIAAPRVITVSPSEYNAANINWAAAQDDHGFTYFGNDMGLIEFGRWDRDESGELHYTSLVPQEERLKPHNGDIWQIYITQDGVLFQSFHELYHYNYKSVRKMLSDTYVDYWEQNCSHTLINYAYCVDNPTRF